MSDIVSFAELDGQHMELLPARTVLSMFSIQDPGSANPGGGLTPGTVTGVVLGATGLPQSSSSGADGSANNGDMGAVG
jgi:hypothetical protein